MKNLKKQINTHFIDEMSKHQLFKVDVKGEDIVNSYIKSFEDGDDPIFRDPSSTSHTCRNCTNFLRRYGNIVAVNENGEMITLWDIIPTELEYLAPLMALKELIRGATILAPFLEEFEFLLKAPYQKGVKKTQDWFRLGIEKNSKVYTLAEASAYSTTPISTKKAYSFNHFFLDIPKRFVNLRNDRRGVSVETIIGDQKSSFDVFYRTMKEWDADSIETVIELISQGSLYNGEQYLSQFQSILKLKETYDSLNERVKRNWCWVKIFEIGNLAKFRNRSAGQAVNDLVDGKTVEQMAGAWNHREDPENKFKVTAPFTKKQYNQALEFVSENGYMESFMREHATLDDIRVSEIHHMNRGNKNKPTTIFDSIKAEAKTRSTKLDFSKVQEIPIEKFMENVLPRTREMSVFFEGRHVENLCNLITSKHKENKPMFNYGNSYCVTAKGGNADVSQIKKDVQDLGGKIDGVLRFSIGWCGESSKDDSDLDARCIENLMGVSGTSVIYFGKKISQYTHGNLDIDITDPIQHKRTKGKGVVENINYPRLEKMIDGEYTFCVNQYAEVNSEGFNAEIEFDGQLYSYEYNKPVKEGETVTVAVVTKVGTKLTIEHKLTPSSSEGVIQEVWGINTQSFHNVSLVCLSPNHWDKPVGAKRYLFFLQNCKNPDEVRGFHSVDFNQELRQHRRVLEPLGSKNLIPYNDDQLAGLSFNSTVTDYVIVKVVGQSSRLLKIIF